MLCPSALDEQKTQASSLAARWAATLAWIANPTHSLTTRLARRRSAGGSRSGIGSTQAAAWYGWLPLSMPTPLSQFAMPGAIRLTPSSHAERALDRGWDFT
jgi:hypothetical protein